MAPLLFRTTIPASTGQLTLSQNSVQPLGESSISATAMVSAGGVIYVLDNEPITITFNGKPPRRPARFFPSPLVPAARSRRSRAARFPTTGPALSNPIYIMIESKGKFLYVANQGNNVQGPNPQSGIAGYFVTTAPAYQLSFIADEPFGSGSGPQCMVEDPSDQFVYKPTNTTPR